MNLFNYDFKTVLLYVEQAYTKLYGEQYRKIIHDRLQSAEYIFYSKETPMSFYKECELRGFDLNDKATEVFLTAVFQTTSMGVRQIKKADKLCGCMFFPVEYITNGMLDYAFLHECNHIITISNYYSVGFDELGNHYVNVSETREYETLNETFNDIFALECINLLRHSGIYLADKEKLTLDCENDNTTHEIKEIVRLLVDDYREEIINANITGNYNTLFNKIGKENFDRFNHIVNRVQRLIDDGLFETQTQESFKEYYSLIEEAETVLNMMNDHSMKNSAKR